MSADASSVTAAFPNTAPFLLTITGCPPEILDIQRAFHGKSWVDIDAATCIRHSDALLMMDPGPLVYFLPAFLIAAIHQPRSTAAEFLVYFVCGDAFDTIIPHLDRAQHKAVLDTVEAVLNADHGFFADQTEAFFMRIHEFQRQRDQPTA